jgi:hypothetical protein
LSPELENPIGLRCSGLRAGGHPGGICLARVAANGLAIHSRHPCDLALARARSEQRQLTLGQACLVV